MTTDATELQQLLGAQPKPDCAALTPFVVQEASFDEGRVVLLFAPQPAFKNHFGNVQGGFAVAMIDALISVAAFAKTRLWLPTVEIKSSFVAPMKLGECRGEGSVIKAGKQLVFLESRLWGADGKLAVHATATAAMPLQSGWRGSSRPTPYRCRPGCGLTGRSRATPTGKSVRAANPLHSSSVSRPTLPSRWGRLSSNVRHH